jgi:hypothetical protein
MLPARAQVIPAYVARPEIAIAAAVPEVVRAVQADPLVLAIRADDAAGWEGHRASSFYDQPRSAPAAVQPTSPPPEPAVDPAAERRRQALHDELMKVGDGKTFVLCSNGCPQSGASWDGRRGETLTGNHQ